MASREKDILKKAGGGALGGLFAGGVPGALIGGAIGLGESIWSARRADSAHQREVRDLQRAGLNPILSARGAGSDVGDVSGASRGVGAGLAVQRARAEIELLQAQAYSARSSGRQAAVMAADIESQAASGRYESVRSGADLAALSVQEKQTQLKLLTRQIEADIRSKVASAAQAEALAVLSKLAVPGAENTAELELQLRKLAPGIGRTALQSLMEIVRSLRR